MRGMEKYIKNAKSVRPGYIVQKEGINQLKRVLIVNEYGFLEVNIENPKTIGWRIDNSDGRMWFITFELAKKEKYIVADSE
jgi:hypothetical protein